MSLFDRVKSLLGKRDEPSPVRSAQVAIAAPQSTPFPSSAPAAVDVLDGLKVENVRSVLPHDLDPKFAELFMRLGPPAPVGRLNLNGRGIPRERAEAAEACKRIEREVTGAAAERCIIRYKYPPSSRSKCIRDIGIVLNWCIFAMVIDDPALLETHFLNWLREVYARLGLPGGTTSVVGAFVVLREELFNRLEPDHFALMEPYLSRVVEVLGSNRDQLSAAGSSIKDAH